MNLVAIHSPARQSGKTTVANVFLAHGFQLAKMAGGIYAMWTALLDYAQVPLRRQHDSITTLKETLIPEVGCSFRHFAEGPGHACRALIAKDFWANIGRSHVGRRLENGERLVVDDVRLVNEADMLRELGAKIVSVWRPGHDPSLPSEIDSPLADYPFDVVFANTGTMEQLQAKVLLWIGSQARWRSSPSSCSRRRTSSTETSSESSTSSAGWS